VQRYWKGTAPEVAENLTDSRIARERAPWNSSVEKIRGRVPWKSSVEEFRGRVPWKSSVEERPF
jgi:hypothetical protein